MKVDCEEAGKNKRHREQGRALLRRKRYGVNVNARGRRSEEK